jgi:asparaginyl-tRNA synthetase
MQDDEGRHFDPDRFLRILDDPWYQLLVTLQDHIHTSTNAFWTKAGAIHLSLPLTTGAVSSPVGLGSDSSPVSIKIRNRPIYLADSMQFMLEYGCRFQRRGCYYIMPSFRDEDPDESHLSEFFHSEAEILGDLEAVISTVEGYLRAVVGALLVERTALNEVANGTEHLDAFLAMGSIPRLTFDAAVKALAEDPSYIQSSRDGAATWRTLTRSGELELIRQAGGPVWVTHFDRMAVPFYQAVDRDGTQALAADLLLGIGETVGCGQRHTSGDDLREAARTHGVDAASYDWYIRMKDHVPLETSGFGVGLERLIAWVLGHHDIRDLQLVPRHPNHTLAP